MLKEITISLLLTEKCNYECNHCLYSLSPREPGKFITPKVLDKVGKQVERLSDSGTPVILNLIGGEPLLFLSKFESLLYEVSTWQATLEMTTNGHWLEISSKRKRVGNLLQRFDIMVRISDDEFHRKFRKMGPEEFECKVERFREEFGLREEYLFLDDCPTGLDWVVPRGRGYLQSTSQDHAKFCHGKHSNSLSFSPDGKLKDFCCRGSEAIWGSVDTPFEELIDFYKEFMKREEVNCYSCDGELRNYCERKGKQ